MSISITDQLSNFINLSFPPKRIVSLVPSQTELLYDLGLNEEVVGITKFCIHPKIWFRGKQRIGGTKTVNIGIVKNLQPHLIIANKEENVKEQVEELRLIAPVYVSDINTLEEALEMINGIGKLVDKQTRANALAAKIEKAFQQLIPVNQTVNTAYFIWKNPYMAAGGDTFINDMLNRCGFINIFQNVNRYPEISISKYSINNNQQLISNSTSIIDSQPSSPEPSTVCSQPSSSELSTANIHPSSSELSTVNSQPLSSEPSTVNCHPSSSELSSLKNCHLLLLSSEPYPFKQKHIDELQSELAGCKILLVDGEMFSWYGSRLLYAAEYFKNLIEQIQR